MRYYVYHTICDICGGEGVASAKDAGKDWLGNGLFRHNDPFVCRDIVREKLSTLQRAQSTTEPVVTS